MPRFTSAAVKIFFSFVALYFSVYEVMARAGGGGGGHSSGGGHSYSSHSYGGGSYGHSYGGGGSGGGPISFSSIIIIIIILVVISALRKKSTGVGDGDTGVPNIAPQPYPDGLNGQKVTAAFYSIQEAWQRKDLVHVRKWISDGVYQRYTAQFAMMNKLGQVNKLSNIRINDIRVAKTGGDGDYQTADVAVSFTMDDEFVSEKYPQFNERFIGDSDTEYWTFIKKKNGVAGKNLYNNDNCPNCGAPLDIKMGEISRCSSCGTLTNNAEYDWVLSEITQTDDYTGDNRMEQDEKLHEIMKDDKLFSVQRMEDVASNVFMQVMEVLGGEKGQKLERFADKDTIATVLAEKKKLGDFVFDRLYLRDVTLMDFITANDCLNLVFDLTATYQRVRTGEKLQWIDTQQTDAHFKLVLAKKLSALKTPAKETVYSYECSSCGAPYTDTTHDTCEYCGATVVDLNSNWVLTQFRFL
ncbi:MAG TPA: TIM44-like domain-containing protein [Chitinophagales bacterium]|nr:TIM44-like domain-containing protein [Chitinophagales bacterium]